ncbi:MAG: hypothetical protein HC802_04070 [Caldilineaceae bacterium]|nr:hypothetical protein [Caldilineaceae bacterium]
MARPMAYQGISRRNVVRILAGASLLPVVYTIAAPAAAHAQSVCASDGESCEPGQISCCEGYECCDFGDNIIVCVTFGSCQF